jgi:hypothetical protein
VLVILLNDGQQPEGYLPKHHTVILLKLGYGGEYLSLLSCRELITLLISLREVFPFHFAQHISPHAGGLYKGFYHNCPNPIVGSIKDRDQRGVVEGRHSSIREAC